MKPPPFEYCRPDTVDEALELLAEFGSDASVLSGGQSLGAMLNMRLVRPAALIDVNRLVELTGTGAHGGHVSTGAIVRQSEAVQCPELRRMVPLLGLALPYVGHYQTRTRGTLGGSVAHADPSAEIPLCLTTLGGSVMLRSRRGVRELAARDFFRGALTTARQGDELLTGLNWPQHQDGTVYAFEEITQRHGDFAIVAVAAAARISGNGAIEHLAFGLGGVEERPGLVEVSEFLGQTANDAVATAAAEQAAGAVDPLVDLQASAAYRRQLVRVLGAGVLSRVFREARRLREAC